MRGDHSEEFCLVDRRLVRYRKNPPRTSPNPTRLRLVGFGLILGGFFFKSYWSLVSTVVFQVLYYSFRNISTDFRMILSISYCQNIRFGMGVRFEIQIGLPSSNRTPRLNLSPIRDSKSDSLAQIGLPGRQIWRRRV